MKKYPALLIIGLVLLIFGLRKNNIPQAKWSKVRTTPARTSRRTHNQSSDSRGPRADRNRRPSFRCFEKTNSLV